VRTLAGASPPSGAHVVTDEDRTEAQKRTNDFVTNSFRIPAVRSLPQRLFLRLRYGDSPSRPSESKKETAKER